MTTTSELRFSLAKYKEWLRDREKLDNATIDIILFMNEYSAMDGMPYDTMWADGFIVLPQWCK